MDSCYTIGGMAGMANVSYAINLDSVGVWARWWAGCPLLMVGFILSIVPLNFCH